MLQVLINIITLFLSTLQHCSTAGWMIFLTESLMTTYPWLPDDIWLIITCLTVLDSSSCISWPTSAPRHLLTSLLIIIRCFTCFIITSPGGGDCLNKLNWIIVIDLRSWPLLLVSPGSTISTTLRTSPQAFNCIFSNSGSSTFDMFNSFNLA